jgi:hypothetical protein
MYLSFGQLCMPLLLLLCLQELVQVAMLTVVCDDTQCVLVREVVHIAGGHNTRQHAAACRESSTQDGCGR